MRKGNSMLGVCMVSLVWGRLGPRDEGQDLLEYALVVALIALVAATAVTGVGTTIKTVFWDVIASSTGDI